jgi:succinate dehydrogenase / fumarate reductase membrane anchor subunit
MVTRRAFQSGSLAWFLQRVTAVVLLFTLAFHFLWLHFVNHAAEVTLWGTGLRMDRLSYAAVLVLFLVTAAFHGVNGVYNALVNQGLKGRPRQAAAWLLGLAGTVLVVQGLRVAVAMAGVVD